MFICIPVAVEYWVVFTPYIHDLNHMSLVFLNSKRLDQLFSCSEDPQSHMAAKLYFYWRSSYSIMKSPKHMELFWSLALALARFLSQATMFDHHRTHKYCLLIVHFCIWAYMYRVYVSLPLTCCMFYAYVYICINF